MIRQSALGVRGHLIDLHNDGKFVFRVYGEPDPVSGHRSFVDYKLAVHDLHIEITSDYYSLYTPEPGKTGTAQVNYTYHVVHNPLARLRARLISRDPGFSGRIDPPADPHKGTWHLDLVYRDQPYVTVAWRADRGFGLWLPSDGLDYGTGFDEVFETYDAVLARIMELLRK
jgi:hypothetical protein